MIGLGAQLAVTHRQSHVTRHTSALFGVEQKLIFLVGSLGNTPVSQQKYLTRLGIEFAMSEAWETIDYMCSLCTAHS